jgi:hypothetical protein
MNVLPVDRALSVYGALEPCRDKGCPRTTFQASNENVILKKCQLVHRETLPRAPVARQRHSQGYYFSEENQVSTSF